MNPAQQEIVRTTFAKLAVMPEVAGALFYVWQHIYVVRQGYELERLRGTHAKLVQENKMLRLEAGQLRSLRRVEEIARVRLGMLTPKPGQVVLLPESTIQ